MEKKVDAVSIVHKKGKWSHVSCPYCTGTLLMLSLAALRTVGPI